MRVTKWTRTQSWLDGRTLTRQFRKTIVALMLIGGLAACNKGAGQELWQVTQCFKPLSDTSYPRRNELYRDEARGCWGQRWAIPKSYLPHMQAKLMDSEKIILYLNAAELIQSQTRALENSRRDWRYSVQITPLTHAGFEVKRVRIRDMPSRGLQRTDRRMFGFDVYDTKDKTQPRDVFFFSDERRDVFAQCSVRLGEEVESKSPDSVCKVFTHINHMFDVNYFVRYSDMPELIAINAEIQTRIVSHSLSNVIKEEK